MKKVLFTLFAASLLLTVGCNKKDDNVDVVFPEPATKAQAVSIAFDKGEDLKLELPERAKPSDPGSSNPDNLVDVKIPLIELTEGNRYVLYMEEATKSAAGLNVSTVWTGNYIYDKDGNIYRLEHFGEVKVSEGHFTLIPKFQLVLKAGEPEPAAITLPATISTITTTTTVASNLSRTWKVVDTYISIQGGKNQVSFSNSFTGCDFHEIGKNCKDMKVSLSDDDLAALQGYKVKEIMLEGNNSIIITFDSKDPYYGSYNANGTSFSWSLNDSNQLLSASASGTVGFPKNGQVELVLNTTVTGGNETYTGTITLRLEQVN